jgi:hypothetical protein
MHATHLNEHDANQGAQSSGEFLGMTGNSGWYLLGSGGATILMVVLLWGMLGVSLLLCLFVGLSLGALSVAYVFTLKNNRPAHYDTDFFEAALVEAGVLAFVFGPRSRRPENPFEESAGAGLAVTPAAAVAPRREHRSATVTATGRAPAAAKNMEPTTVPVSAAVPAPSETARGKSEAARAEQAEPMVARREFDRLQEQLAVTEELLDDALAERVEG